jgi:uncharacterized membrane protein
LAAALGYPIGLISIILFCTETENRFVKFHAVQSILLHVGAGLLLGAFGLLIAIVFLLLGESGGTAGNAGTTIVWVVGMLMWCLFPLLFLVAVIVSAVKAYGGAEFKLPLIGNISSNLANKWTG